VHWLLAMYITYEEYSITYLRCFVSSGITMRRSSVVSCCTGSQPITLAECMKIKCCLVQGRFSKSQMDMKRKTYIRTWTKHLFLDISSANIDTLVPSLYQCVETRSIKVFSLFTQTLPHLRFNLVVISETFPTQL
jgi:hypothetical protein